MRVVSLVMLTCSCAATLGDRVPLSFPGCGGNWNCTPTSEGRLNVTFSCSEAAGINVSKTVRVIVFVVITYEFVKAL